jgi:hypothetical protein
MNRHEATEPVRDDARLVVPVTTGCSARWKTNPGSSPQLVIDYGGAELALEVDDPQDAEVFALSLALTALGFASHCRYLMGDRDG